MKWLVLLLIVAAGAFFGYPLVNEDSGGECDALERAAIRVGLSSDDHKPAPQDAMIGQFIQDFSKGQFASVAVRNEYPNVPVSIACTALYWRTIVDPKGFRDDSAKLRP
jgi:hypothetical protein